MYRLRLERIIASCVLRDSHEIHKPSATLSRSVTVFYIFNIRIHFIYKWPLYRICRVNLCRQSSHFTNSLIHISRHSCLQRMSCIFFGQTNHSCITHRAIIISEDIDIYCYYYFIVIKDYAIIHLRTRICVSNNLLK